MIPKTGGWSGRNIETGVLLEEVNMTDYTKWGDWKVLCHIIATRYQVCIEDAEELLHQLMDQDSGIKRRLMQALIHSKNQRELEQIIFSFEIPISLAVLTHITRHRMHSLLVPDFVPLWNMENYVTPETVAKDHEKEYWQTSFKTCRRCAGVCACICNYCIRTDSPCCTELADRQCPCKPSA